MRRAFALGSTVLLAALMSGCTTAQLSSYGYTGQWLVVTRDIAPGEVIREGDLKIAAHYVRPLYSGDWGWADASDRSNVIGHRSKIAMDAGWPFSMSEIER
jgi:SAF domain-containing protein